MPAQKQAEKETTVTEKQKRVYLKQLDVPSCSISEALRVAAAIADNYGSDPTAPLKVAKALDLEPGGSPFRMLTGASIAYGITEGGSNAVLIKITDLGKRMIKPLVEGDDLIAKREGFLKPRIVEEFMSKYSGSSLPRGDIAYNVLEEMGVPKGKLEHVFGFLVSEARKLGFIEEIKNKQYVHIDEISELAVSQGDETDDQYDVLENDTGKDEGLILHPEQESTKLNRSTKNNEGDNRRVFITHGKNKHFVDPIKKLLGFGEMIPVVATEKHSVSQPVPDKVMEDMRSCSAAIIHVEEELPLIDLNAKQDVVLNPNVLIEIGAAMALYGRRFILVVKDGLKLPSNLQGLYEVRYQGEKLDGDATIRLIEAINDIKNHPFPIR